MQWILLGNWIWKWHFKFIHKILKLLPAAFKYREFQIKKGMQFLEDENYLHDFSVHTCAGHARYECGVLVRAGYLLIRRFAKSSDSVKTILLQHNLAKVISFLTFSLKLLDFDTPEPLRCIKCQDHEPSLIAMFPQLLFAQLYIF